MHLHLEWQHAHIGLHEWHCNWRGAGITVGAETFLR